MKTMTVADATSLYQNLVANYGLKDCQPGLQLFGEMPPAAQEQLAACTAVLMAQPRSTPRVWAADSKN